MLKGYMNFFCKLALILSMLVLPALPASAQTHTFPAEDTNNVFSGTNQFNLGIIVPPISVASLPSAAANVGGIISVSDSTTISEEGQTCVGGSSTTAFAFSNGSVWQCFGLGGGGSSVNINGVLISSPNFNGTAPTPDSGFLPGVFKVSGSNVILEIPYGNTSTTFLAGNGNALTATQFAATPTQCSGSLPLTSGIAANGNANCIAAGNSLYLNSLLVSNANLNSTSPSPDSNYLACAVKVSGSNAIIECPYGNTSTTFLAGNGNALTATALAATPTQCSGGTPLLSGIQANGNGNCTSGSGGPGTGTANAIAVWASPTPTSLGSIVCQVTGQVLTAVNGSAPACSSPTIPIRTNSSSTDAVLCDSGTTTLDRYKLLVETNGTATAVTLPDQSTSGCLSLVFAIGAGGSGTVTTSRTSTNTFSIFNGISFSSSQTSFALTAGQCATVSGDGGSVYYVRLNCGSGSGSGLVSFTTGNFSPLFTVSLGGSPTTSPAIAFSASNAAANTVFGNATGSPAPAAFTTNPVVTSLTTGSGGPGCSWGAGNAGGFCANNGTEPTGVSGAWMPWGDANNITVNWESNNATPQHLPIMLVLQGAAYTNATTAFSNVVGGSGPTLAFPANASTVYGGRCYLVYSASVSTAGPKIQFTGPGSPTAVLYSTQFQLTATPTYADSAAASAFSTSQSAGTAVTATTLLAARIAFSVLNGTTAGTITLQAAAQGTGTLTLEPGSYCAIQ